MDYEKLGRAVCLARKEKGLTQERLAAQAGISTSFLGHIERGTRKASLETLCGIGVVLKLDLNLALCMPVQVQDAYKQSLLAQLGGVLFRHREEW